MLYRFRRGALVLAFIASATTTVTLLEVSTASAASFSFTLNTGGSTGRVNVDALYGGCTGSLVNGGYDASWEWDANGNLTKSIYWTAGQTNPDPISVPTNGAGCGSAALSTLRLELYPSSTTYNPWVGNFGGANSQRDRSVSGSGFTNFGVVPVPTLGQIPAGGAYPAFRITGSIMSSTPVANGRLKVDVFQVPCGFPDFCVQPPQSTTGAYIGGFASGSSIGNQWTGSVGWPGRYQLYVEDTLTHRKVFGWVNIADGQVPVIDLDAPCFGIWNCQYDFGGLATPSGGFHPLAPTRILDTRSAVGINGKINRGDGRLPNDFNPVNRVNETANHELKVTGVGGIPASGVSAVLLNVTAVTPPGGDWLTVFPRPPSVNIFDNQGTYSAPPPSTSNLNLSVGETVPNLVLARVGAGGTIRFFNASASGMHVIADVAGWFDTGAPEVSPGGLGFTGVTPERLMDTRLGIGDTIGHVMPGDIRELKVTGVAGVPTTAQSVVLNVTAAAPTGTGFVTVYPNGGSIPNASNLNLNPSQTRANLVVVKVGTGGKIRLAAFETDLDLIVDVFGYYGSGGGLTTAINPARIVDSRLGLGTPGAPFGAGEARVVKVTGVGGVPANARAVILNVTAAETTSWGWLTVWPTGGTRPSVSSVNWPGGRNTPNMVMVAVGSGGLISIYNDLGQVSVIVDVFGYVV